MEIKAQLVLQSGVSRGLREVLLSGYGRVYPSEIVSKFGPLRGPRCRDNLTHGLISTQVKDAVQIAQGARFWGPRDHAACFEGVLKACRGRGAWKEARNVLERLENEVEPGNNEDDVEAVERAATASYVAAIGACARNIDDDADSRWSCARDLLD